MNKIEEVLKAENLLLKQQLAEVQNYLVGFNLGLRLAITPKMEGIDIFCSHSDALGVLTQMLAPAIKCIQLGGAIPSATILPFYDINIFVSQDLILEASHPLTKNVIKIRTNEIDILRAIPAGSIDTIFILHSFFLRSRDDQDSLLKEALRVANTQIVISNIFLDELNTAFNNFHGPKYPTNIVKASLTDGLKEFSKIRFKISGLPDSDESFIAIFNVSSSTKESNELNTRLVLITEVSSEKLEFFGNDLIIGDVKLMQTDLAKVANFRPMFLSVLAKNLDLPNNQLRRIVAYYDLLEGYFQSCKNVVAHGHEASLILKYLERFR